jgi:preprotein translocase SecE subunit
VARDRQRAKQRRAKRQPGTGGGSRAPRGPDRDVAASGAEAAGERAERDLAPGGTDPVRDTDRDADAGDPYGDPLREDESVDTPLGRGTAAPAPWLHSSADVDEARLAEAGAIPPSARDDEDDEEDFDDFERAPDEAQGDAPIRRGGVVTEGSRERHRGRVLTFLGHCVDELRRVQWPDRKHVGQATAVVLGFVVLAGGYLGLLDALWRPLVEAII